MSHRLQWIAPFRPLRTGIANYTEDLFDAVDGKWPLQAVLEKGSSDPVYRTIHAQPVSTLKPDQPTIATLGNSEFHDIAYAYAQKHAGIVVLHDVHLHDARAAMAVRMSQSRQYWRELDSEYGPEGVRAGRALLAGATVKTIGDFPMFESIVRRARATIVHSEYAAKLVRARVPDAKVHVIPMGIPTPAFASRADARRILGLRQDAFVIASVTHVNPNKRLPIVLRAIRRLLPIHSNLQFLVAGSGSDSNAFRDEVRILGLESVVKSFGYVDDALARVIASAADTCVNLRFPTAGETSASLLRLLGVGRPVLVSDAGTAAELPAGIAIKIPVDHLEIDMIVHSLATLAKCPGLCRDLSVASREHVGSEHSMSAMANAYRDVIEDVFGIALPYLDDTRVEEAPLDLETFNHFAPVAAVPSAMAQALLDLGLKDSIQAIDAVGTAVAELGLDRQRTASRGAPSTRLLRRVACPACQGSIDPRGSCTSCRYTVRTHGAVVDLREENAAKEQMFY